MGVIGTIIGLIVVGLIAGAIARLVVPGKQHISIPMTILLGIIGSIIGAIIVLLIYVRVSGRGSRNR